MDMDNEDQISTTLHYLKTDPKWESEKPFTLFVDVSAIIGARNTNIIKQPVPEVLINNARSVLDSLSLDRNGFEVIQLRPQDQPGFFEDASWVEENYDPFLCGFLKQHLGAKEVRVYEHKLRYRHPGFGDETLRGHANYDPPIPHVHADMTPAYGRQLFAEKWPEALNAARTQVLNVWRPLVDHVTEWPLALCDYESVDNKDLCATDQIKRLKGSKPSDNAFVQIESYVAHHNPKHHWYYLKNQAFHEGWLIKLYDSKSDTAHSILHTSFDIGEGCSARRSCEMRVLVKY